MLRARKRLHATRLVALLWCASAGACGADEVSDASLLQVLDAQVEAGLGDLDSGLGPLPGSDGGDAKLPTADAAAQAGGAGPVDAGGVIGPEPGRLAGFTAEHNAARARAMTTMPLVALTWSPEIATVAQAYAERLAAGCLNSLAHSTQSERNNWGENLAAFTITNGKGDEANGTPQRTLALWESELSCYTFGPFMSGVNATCTEACSKYGGCGHLTQILWRKTSRVGCGVADCTEGKTRKSYWVCNYDPAGNVTGQLPY